MTSTASVELRSACEAALQRLDPEAIARHGPLVDVTLQPFSYATSFPVDEVVMTLTDGMCVSMLRKTLDTEMLLPEAREAKPSFLLDPEREIEAYERVPVQLDGTRYLGSYIDRSWKRCWLFLEKIPGNVLWQEGDLEPWRATARWLSRLHELGPPADARRLLRYDRRFFERWPRRVERFRRSQPEVTALVAAHERLIDELVALPVTFVHGELVASNVLIARREGRLRVCPVDWEMAGIGPPHLDVAALVSGWGPDVRETLIAAYEDTLPLDGCSARDLRRGVDLCRFHLCMRWLGWAARWRPPDEHQHDWLAEALQLADQLGGVTR